MSTTRKSLAALIALAAFGLAQAQEATVFPQETQASTKTRAEVIAEVLAARQNGTLMLGNEGPGTWALSTPSMRERISVLKEAIAAAQLSPQERRAQRLQFGM